MTEEKGTVETLEMSITPDYVPHWDTAAALRELLQNALDAQTQGFSMDLSENEHQTMITNWGADLPLKTLLLGATTKADNEEEIGQFGEGYKLACLVLARQDIEIEIASQQGTIYPFISYSNKYQSDILAFNWNKEQKFQAGVQISFKKSQVPLAWIKSLVLLESPQEVRILKDKPGKIYGGGLHLNLETNESKNLEENFHWGYNLAPKDLEMDRDRRMISNYSLSQALVACLEQFESPESIYHALETPYPEFKDIARHNIKYETEKKLYEVFKHLHSPKAVAVDSNTSEEHICLIERAGFIPIKIKSNALFLSIDSKQNSQETLVQIAKNRGTDREEYSPSYEEQERLNRAMDILHSIAEGDYFNLALSQLSTSSIQTVLFIDPTILGLWSPESRNLYISAKCLKSVGEILLLIIHEITHSKYLGHGDNFHQAVDNLTIKVFDFILEKGA